jgi:hypothetical protein
MAGNKGDRLATMQYYLGIAINHIHTYMVGGHLKKRIVVIDAISVMTTWKLILASFQRLVALYHLCFQSS